ncbi:MAG TPA: tRNA (pseudouridine(54)-N(1))-methyltransferase TrmY [Candidatus Fraserbacteria bacterium]|nr:tRNA (pseudouridine(54)-N(1))-methyltransferase TrmY [Candidatus Fraserbacteria bacterium]
MRVFIVLGHTAALTPDFTLNDLPGSAGRLDILCRCVTAAFCLSHGIRRQINVYLVLQDRITIRLDGRYLRHLNPDERSTGALLQKALQKIQQAAPDLPDELRSTPGIFVSRRGLAQLLAQLRRQVEQIIWLHEGGRDLRSAELDQSSAFVLSDHRDFSPEEETLLGEFARLSLGPQILHADHCITVVHNELDRREP